MSISTTTQNSAGLRILGAARKSNKVTDDNGKGLRAIGIEIQDQRITDWAEANGHVLVDIAADTKSGRVAPWHRKNLKPWVTDPSLMAQYDAIAATSNDRLSRGDWNDEIEIRQWALRNGKRLIIIDGPQWPARNEGDEQWWDSNAKQARREWEEIQARISRSHKRLREKGSLIGRPPWGYTSAGDKYARKLVPTENGRLYVPQIYARVIDGESYATIATWLTKVTGRVWWPTAVGKLIKCPTYTGNRCEWDETTKTYGALVSRNEALIDMSTFRRANTEVANRQKRGPLALENRAPLVTALFCEHCEDSPMYRLKCGYRDTRANYYRCFGRGAQRKSCGNLVRADRLEATVDAIIAASWHTEVMAHTVIAGNAAEVDARLKQIRFEIQQLAARDDLGDDEIEERTEALKAERDKLKADPIIPDHVDYTGTGEFWALLWREVPAHERGQWLSRNGFKIRAGKQRVSVANGAKVAVHEFTS